MVLNPFPDKEANSSIRCIVARQYMKNQNILTIYQLYLHVYLWHRVDALLYFLANKLGIPFCVCQAYNRIVIGNAK